MSLDEILAEPGFTVDEEAAEGLRVILDCIESDYVESGVGEIKDIVPGYENKCVTVIFKTCYLSGTEQHDGEYFANLMRIADAVGIRYDASDGFAWITFTCSVWK